MLKSRYFVFQFKEWVLALTQNYVRTSFWKRADSLQTTVSISTKYN